jgi:nitrous-oxide reductase
MKKSKQILVTCIGIFAILLSLNSCRPKSVSSAASGDAAAKSYVAPGQHDEFYNFLKYSITL